MKSYGVQKPRERSIRKMKMETLRVVNAGAASVGRLLRREDYKKEGRKVRLGKQEKHSFQVG